MKIRILVACLLSLVGVSLAHAQSPQPAVASTSQLSDVRNAWTQRSLTPQKNELQLLIGPNSVQGLSIRNGFSSMQGGSEFGLHVRRHHAALSGSILGISGRISTGQAQGMLPIGVSFAPVDRLEIGLALPFMFGLADVRVERGMRDNVNGAFADMPVWATYQLTEGNVEIGLRATFYLPTQTRFQFQGGVPILARVNGMRVESGLFIHATFLEGPSLTELFVPFRMGFQITPEWFAGFRTGMNLGFIDGNTLFTMPLYGFAGYTLPTSMGPIDLGVQFGFDQLLRANPVIANRPTGPNIGYPGDGNFDVSDFSLSIGANVALQF